jgi:hypothetical protein
MGLSQKGFVVFLNSPCLETHKNAIKEKNTYLPRLMAICQIYVVFSLFFFSAPRPRRQAPSTHILSYTSQIWARYQSSVLCASHHTASLNNSEVVCGFPHLLRVIHYEIVVLDPELSLPRTPLLLLGLHSHAPLRPARHTTA